MKLSISNLAWPSNTDEDVYKLMQKYDFNAIEIAPTRVFPNNPYENLDEVKEWYTRLLQEYGFTISSIQSIWFGKNERLFGTEDERAILLEYTKKVINFAEVIKCNNIVFGCPRNRAIPPGQKIDLEIAIDFFNQIGFYASLHNTTIGLEANPPIYNTNFINDTVEAIQLIKTVKCPNFLLNLDLGAMIINGENISILEKCFPLINHVHISEPELKAITTRNIHNELATFLKKNNFSGYVSIEMRTQAEINLIESSLKYIRDVFI
jgi:sugar phosphate isomerase/epimerase